MSDPQRLMALGRIAELEARLRELAVLIEGDVISINHALFIAVHGVEGLKIAQAAAEFRQLQEHHAEYAAKSADLARLRETWG